LLSKGIDSDIDFEPKGGVRSADRPMMLHCRQLATFAMRHALRSLGLHSDIELLRRPVHAKVRSSIPLSSATN